MMVLMIMMIMPVIIIAVKNSFQLLLLYYVQSVWILNLCDIFINAMIFRK